MNQRKETPLHLSAFGGFGHITSELIKHGADVNALTSVRGDDAERNGVRRRGLFVAIIMLIMIGFLLKDSSIQPIRLFYLFNDAA